MVGCRRSIIGGRLTQDFLRVPASTTGYLECQAMFVSLDQPWNASLRLAGTSGGWDSHLIHDHPIPGNSELSRTGDGRCTDVWSSGGRSRPGSTYFRKELQVSSSIYPVLVGSHFLWCFQGWVQVEGNGTPDFERALQARVFFGMFLVKAHQVPRNSDRPANPPIPSAAHHRARPVPWSAEPTGRATGLRPADRPAF